MIFTFLAVIGLSLMAFLMGFAYGNKAFFLTIPTATFSALALESEFFLNLFCGA